MNKDIGKLSSIGNQARTLAISPEQRKTIASNAAKKRWSLSKSKVCVVNLNNSNWCDFHDRPLSRCKDMGLLPK